MTNKLIKRKAIQVVMMKAIINSNFRRSLVAVVIVNLLKILERKKLRVVVKRKRMVTSLIR